MSPDVVDALLSLVGHTMHRIQSSPGDQKASRRGTEGRDSWKFYFWARCACFLSSIDLLVLKVTFSGSMLQWHCSEKQEELARLEVARVEQQRVEEAAISTSFSSLSVKYVINIHQTQHLTEHL